MISSSAMNASYFLVLLALLMPLALCYPQPAMDEDKEQEMERYLSQV
jgi:hypothetical protein